MERHSVSNEVESALISTAVDPVELAKELASIRELDGYVLRPRRDETIVDEYLDTREARLGSRHVAFRVRRLDGAAKLTVKGPTRGRSGPASSRVEIERRWSRSAASGALRALATLDVPLTGRTAPRAWKSPEEFAKSLGLFRVQKRQTIRRPREVRRAGRSTSRPLAELAVDLVTYTIGRRKVRLLEVEVEAKRSQGIQAADRITSLLVARWGGDLRAWPHSKLATGLALDHLEKEGKLADVVSSGGWLTPRGVALVSRRLALA